MEASKKAKTSIQLLKILLVFGLTNCRLSMGQATTTQVPTLAHLRVAEQLVNHCSDRNTSYQHGKSLVSWKTDTSDYQCYTDCSGFLNAVLRQTYQLDKAYFKNWMGVSRPYAYHYFDAISAENHFRAVHMIGDIKPGDIIAIKYVDRSEHDNNTGHCMLVAGLPRLIPANAVELTNTNQYQVLVIDSSKSPHGKDDSRKLGNDQSYDGLGKGYFRLYADNQGAIVGYSWSTQRPKEGYNPLENPIVVGEFTAF